MRALSSRESRLLAIALPVAVAALIDVVLVMPLQSGFAARAQQRQALLAQYAANDRLIGDIPRLGRAAAQRDRQLAGYMLAAPDAAAAADILRSRLEAAATAVGADYHGGEDIAAAPGTLVGTLPNTLPGRPPDRIATRATLRLSAAQLAQFLVIVENGRPFVTIGGLTIRAEDPLATGHVALLEVTLEAAIAYRPATAR